MTLKTRNSFIKVFLLSSLILLALMTVLFIISSLNHSILTPPDLRIPSFLSYIPFAKQNFASLLISFLILLLYVPLCFYMLLRFFENTQTSEIIFFTGFLVACMTESARFLTLCLGLWQTFSNMLILAGKIVLFGRTLAPLSFLCAAILSETDQRQDMERNYIILFTVAIVFAAVIPMNTARITSTALVTEGFMGLINATRFLIFGTMIISFLVQGIKKNSMEYMHLASSCCVLILGYTMLVSCDNFVFLILGTAGLSIGTFRYLKFIHKMYMWS